MVCTGTPSACQCRGRCPMAAAKASGATVTPMNDAARRAQGLSNEPTGEAPVDDLRRAVARLFGGTS